MASEAELLALAERVERSLPWEVDNSPHFHNMRALDLEIARSVGWDSAQSSGRGDRYGIPAYTASLDAAMTLIPGDEAWDVGKEFRTPIYVADLTCFYPGCEYEEDPNKVPFGRAATPALALCAAALRARAATMTKEQPDG